MPCKDYGWEETAVDEQRARADMLARIACKALTELEKQGRADFLLLDDPEVRNWWTQHKKDDRIAAKEENVRKSKKGYDLIGDIYEDN